MATRKREEKEKERLEREGGREEKREGEVIRKKGKEEKGKKTEIHFW